MDLKTAIKSRKTVRKFTDHYIPNEDLQTILDAARRAPSWANTQVWEFVVLRDREVIRQVTECYSETNPARKCSMDASAVIVVCAKLNVSGCFKGEPLTVFNEWYMFDLGMAVENICLSAHDIGLGSVVVGSMDHEKIAEICKVPDEYAVVVAVPLGEPLDLEKPGSRKKELYDVVHLNSFGEHFTALK
jgi:nitroreductase